MKKILNLKLSNGSERFEEWMEKLDIAAQARVQSYLDRLKMGGSRRNVKALGDEVLELKIDFGPGFRVYFGEDNSGMILLLGGDKGTQRRDISQAKRYWRLYVQK